MESKAQVLAYGIIRALRRVRNRFNLTLLRLRGVQVHSAARINRESPASLTNNKKKSRLSFSRIIQDERRIEWFAQAQANRCQLFLRMNDYLGPAQVRKLKVEEVMAELDRQQIRAKWRRVRFSQRLSFALNDRRSTWAWPRLLGLHLFYIGKWLARQFSGRAA